MLVFPKSISNPSATPTASFVAAKTAAPAKASGSFASALSASQAGAKTAPAASPQATAVAGQSSASAAGTAGAQGASAATSDSLNAAPDAAQSEERFLTLLLAQMRNQDPLNPLDNAQVTTQLAQISTVSGIEKLNTTLSALATKMSASGPVDGAAMIGRSLLVEGDSLSIGSDEAVGANGGFQLDAAAKSVRIDIFGDGAEPVRSLTLDGTATGVRSFEWDGKDSQGKRLAEGTYHFRATAVSGTSEVPAVGLGVERVTGVVRSDTGYQFQTTSGRVFAQDAVRGVI